MDGIVDIQCAKIVAARLKEARLSVGLSTRAVAERASSGHFAGVSVSHTTIAKYENGTSSPPLRVLAVLAEIYERPVSWFLEESKPLQGIRYRYLSSRVLVRERHQYEMHAQHWLEAYVKLERRLKTPLRRDRKIEDTFRSMTPAELAAYVRDQGEYKPRDPIYSVVRILEEFGIRVMELPTTLKIDGLAAKFGNEYAVVLNPSTANDRCRLNAAHELKHVLTGDCESPGKTTRKMDDDAFEFACDLLIPPTELEKAFAGRSAVKLVQAKEHFGISMAAMVYRAEKLRIIDARTAKKLWIQFAKRGWRAVEPGVVRPDRAIRFETLLDKAISEKRLQLTEAAALMGVTRNDLEERLRMAMGYVEAPAKAMGMKGGTFTLRIHED